MRNRRRRFSAITAVVAMLGSLLAVVALSASPASAGTVTTTNACFSNATATYSDLALTLAGTGTPNPATLGGGNVTLGSSSFTGDIPSTLRALSIGTQPADIPSGYDCSKAPGDACPKTPTK